MENKTILPDSQYYKDKADDHRNLSFENPLIYTELYNPKHPPYKFFTDEFEYNSFMIKAFPRQIDLPFFKLQYKQFLDSIKERKPCTLEFTPEYDKLFTKEEKEKLCYAITDEKFAVDCFEYEGDLKDIKLQPLDIEKDFLDDFMALFIGRRRSGKSFLCRWFLYNLKHRYPFVIVITGTKSNDFWQNQIPEFTVYDVDMMDDVLNAIFERQDAIAQVNKYLPDDKKIDRRVLLVLDDVLQNKDTLRFSKPLNRVYVNGRHYDISIICMIQDPRGLPPTIRENTDLCIIFRIIEGGRRASVAEEWLASLSGMSKKERDCFMWANTGLIDYRTCEKKHSATNDPDRQFYIPQALCVLNAVNSDNIYELFKTVVAPPLELLPQVEKFRAGSIEHYLAAKGR